MATKGKGQGMVVALAQSLGAGVTKHLSNVTNVTLEGRHCGGPSLRSDIPGVPKPAVAAAGITSSTGETQKSSHPARPCVQDGSNIVISPVPKHGGRSPHVGIQR